MALPDFLCIGAQKAGTSWLNNALLEHPQIFMPPVNELHFFDRVRKEAPIRRRQVELASKAMRLEKEKGDAANEDYLGYLRHILSFSSTTLEWYEAVYSWPVAEGVRRGDITPSYLEMSRKQVAHAHELLGEVKLILIVRRPADRLLSQLRMWATRDDRTDVPQNETEWMDLFQEMTAKTDRGSYSRGIRIWRSEFGAKNLLVLPFSDMRTDPRGMVARVEDHLGIARYDGYSYLTEQIHATRKLEIPASVIDAAREFTMDEDDYLRRKFGEEFLQKTS